MFRILLPLILILKACSLRAEQPHIDAVKTSRPPSIDGIIEEEEWRGAALLENFTQLEPRQGAPSRRKLTQQFSFEYQLLHVWLDPDPNRQATTIHVIRAQQNFTRDLYVRVFFQTNSVIDRRNLEVVCVWRHKPPFGSLQAL